jgi:hypothetical protein
MKSRFLSLMLESIYLTQVLLLVGCSTPFRQLSVTDIKQDLGVVEGSSAHKWRKYIFDIRIIDNNGKTISQHNTFNVVQQENELSNTLLLASSIGSSSDEGPGVSVETITGLWEQPTLKRPQGAVYVRLYMESEPDDEAVNLSPTSYKATAGYVCYKWAKAMSKTDLPTLLADVLQRNADNWTKTLPLHIPLMDFSLWDLKTNQWEGRSPLPAKVPLSPYRLGKHWIIPVEIEIENADFESNCP